MKKKFGKLIIPIIISLVLLYILVYFEMGKKNLWIKIITILASFAFTYCMEYLIPKVKEVFIRTKWKSTQRKLEKEGRLQDDSTIRISFAYLFRIKIDGKYFLVVNNRTGKYQPVGGAYKFNEEEANYFSENYPVENDNCIPVDIKTKSDYRLLIKNKDLKDFLNRFNKTSNRENIKDLSREFIEEIFATGILNQKEFGSLIYKYCGRHMTDIEYTIFKYYEILLADIVELRLTNKQEELFRQLMGNDSNKYKFATFDEIKSLGVKVGTHELQDNISNHTYKILSENTDKLLMRNKYKETITIEL